MLCSTQAAVATVKASASRNAWRTAKTPLGLVMPGKVVAYHLHKLMEITENELKHS